MDQRDQRGAMPTHDGQPFMPIFWFRWRTDIPTFVLFLGLAGFAFARDSSLAGVMAVLLAGSVLVQGHYAARRVRRGESPWK
jgi:hypothetical protein